MSECYFTCKHVMRIILPTIYTHMLYSKYDNTQLTKTPSASADLLLQYNRI